jgi:hypothetical protein
MCTASSHSIVAGTGSCLCGAYQEGIYDEERDFLKRLDLIPPMALIKPSKIYKEVKKPEDDVAF